VPLFIGFVEAGIPLGVTFSFLIAAPMVNEVALVLLYGLFGWKVAALYVVPACHRDERRWVIGRLHMENTFRTGCVISAWRRCRGGAPRLARPRRYAWQAVKDIVASLAYVLIGIAVGAASTLRAQHFMAGIMGKGAWWSVPAAVLLASPCTRMRRHHPIVQACLRRALRWYGACLHDGRDRLSLPEVIICARCLNGG